MVRCSRTNESGLTIIELLIAVVASIIIVLIGWIVWEYSIRQTTISRSSAAASRNAFSVLRRIEQEVMRARSVQVPDPDYGSVPSMQLVVPTDAGDVRRAFRLVEGVLIVHWKDEAAGQVDAFADISGLTITALDSPSNTRVQIACQSTVNGESVEMTTIVSKRN